MRDVEEIILPMSVVGCKKRARNIRDLSEDYLGKAVNWFTASMRCLVKTHNPLFTAHKIIYRYFQLKKKTPVGGNSYQDNARFFFVDPVVKRHGV